MKPRTRKALRWIGIVFGGVLVLFVLFLIEEHIRGRIELNRYVARMRARGEKFTVAELTPTPAPPDKNGAGLFLSTGFTSGKVVPENLPGSMRYVARDKALAMAHCSVWVIKKKWEILWNTNGVTALWRTNTSTDTPRIRGTNVPMLITSEDLADDVRAVSNNLVQVRAALNYPALDFGLNYSAGLNMSWSHLARVKAPAQWLRAASLSALYETNREASLENLLAIAALSQATTNEQKMISQLVRIAVFQIGVGAIWEALQVDGWTDGQLAELQQACATFEAVLPMERALEMERAMGVQMVDRAEDDVTTFFKSSGTLNVDIDFTPPSVPESFDEAVEPMLSAFKNLVPLFNRFIFGPVWKFAWKDQDKLNLLKYWQRSIDAARAQSAHPDWSRFIAEHDGDFDELFPGSGGGGQDVKSAYDRARFLVSSMFGAVGERSLRRAVTAEASRELLVTALALRRFEMEHGKAPESLERLVPKFLPAVRTDPFDGKLLRYRFNADGSFTLYSVGLNGKDDGGNAGPEKSGSKPQFLNGRDLVWPHAATREEIQTFIEAEAGRSRTTTIP